MIIDGFYGTPFLDAIGEEFARLISEVLYELDDLKRAFYDECSPDSNAYYERYCEKIGNILLELRFPALKIPENADLALVSIGDYSPENCWECETYSFLVENEYAVDFEKVGERALMEWFEDIDFYGEVTNLKAADFVRMEMFRHALRYGVAPYREFSPVTDRLYEGFVDARR